MIIRDALYDLMPIPSGAQAILATPAFLRLDGIQQLGFVSRVWPGARHTRFEHSLGVMHLMHLAVERLRHNQSIITISDTDADTAIAAALLHDIGHYPFSHAIEELGPPIRDHESVGRDIIQHGDIADVLMAEWGVDPVRVAALVNGDPAHLTSNDRLMRGLLGGTLDVDKLDYLPRDARACNVPYGGVDTARLLDSLNVALIDSQPRVVIGDKGVSALHSLVNARQEMFDNVYWHHTNRACMAMLLRAVQDALISGAIGADDLTSHTDASLLDFLSSKPMPDTTRTLADRLKSRRIHKRAVEISARATPLYNDVSALWYDPGHRRNVERHLATQLAAITREPVSEIDILIDIPKPEKWKTDVWVLNPNPPRGMDRLMHWNDVVGLGEESLKRYEDHRRLVRIVASDNIKFAVRKHFDTIWPTALKAEPEPNK